MAMYSKIGIIKKYASELDFRAASVPAKPQSYAAGSGEMLLIRDAVERDAEVLPEIERSSGAIFRTVPGLEWVADDGVLSAERHRALMVRGVCLVVEDEAHGIVGFLSADTAPDALHLCQIAVCFDQQRRGLGRRLIEAAEQRALHRGVSALTLTTFRGVPWNEPYYQRLGFRTLRSGEVDARLRAILERERQAGLPMALRCAMIKPLARRQ